MRTSIVLLVLAVVGCSSTPPTYTWDSTQPKGERPFKDWVHGLGGYDGLAQIEAVEELSSRLPQSAAHGRGPTWEDLMDELFLQKKTELLYAVLQGRQVPRGHFQALGVEFANRQDERAFNLLDSYLASNRMSRYRSNAVTILGCYSRLFEYGRRLTTRMVPIALEDPDPTTRAYAVGVLGDVGQTDSIPVIRMALQDKGKVVELNAPNGVENTVSRHAEEALKRMEEKTGKPIPRKPVGE